VPLRERRGGGSAPGAREARVEHHRAPAREHVVRAREEPRVDPLAERARPGQLVAGAVGHLGEERAAHAVGDHAGRSEPPRHGLRERALPARDAPAGGDHERLAPERVEPAIEGIVVSGGCVGRGELLGAARGAARAELAHQRRHLLGRDAPRRRREVHPLLLANEDAAASERAACRAALGPPGGERAPDRAHVPAA
jgi:hypothetical protein